MKKTKIVEFSATSVVANSSGGLHSKMLYKAWGEVRYASASLPTRYTYTGQHSYMDDPATPGATEGFGLIFYRSRYYDPILSRFAQADTLVPGMGNAQALDRYAYTLNNPANLIDPTGHFACGDGIEDQRCEQYEPISVSTHIKSRLTLTDKIIQGNTTALIELLIPSHIGGRLQLEISLDIGFGISGSVGLNVVYNRNSDEFAANIDWALEPGIGIGAGASGTGGLLVGWGSSNVNDVTTGFSGIISGTAAAEVAVAVSVIAPVNEKGFYVDPYSGQIPSTVYIGGGGGGGYAGIGAGINGPTGIFANLTRFLPWHWNK